ncbi:hypothetical protein [Pengzhenrongella sp.]|jgi:hypothetical protein|uniref:hypothetical protein n=1 Tax=Pengzhenrongella sp. TaxID=2888820 RepID=UPI002F955EF9
MLTDPQERGFFAQPRTIWAGLGVGVLVVVLAIWFFAGGATTPAPKAGATTPAAPAAPSSAPSPRYESACGLSGGTTGSPTAEPRDLKWVALDGWYLPISPSAGPGVRSDAGPWKCFARTPTGALLASAVIVLRADGLADDFETVIREQTMPGPLQDAKIAAGKQVMPSASTAPLGFRIDKYTDDEATISLYVSQGGAGDFTCSGIVQWYEGDWRLRLAPDGGTAQSCIQGPPLGDYIPWGV